MAGENWTTRIEFMLTVLSYNVEYGKKINKIYQFIKESKDKPQIICLQEFPEKELANLERNKIFNNQEFFFLKGLSNKDEFFGELTLINTSKIKIVKTEYLDFGQDRLESIYKRKIIKRSAILNVLKIGRQEVCIVNVHLTPVSLHGKRKKQLAEVIESTQSLRKSIILGDFNYSSLFSRGGLSRFMKKNNYILAGEKLVTNRYKYKIPQQLDYVFYRNLKVKEVKVLDLSYSDHFPVIAKFIF
jgi:endonuclease/exonuclease/phosphatase family metal-dependent hydrolase